MEATALLAAVKWNADGLAPVVIVDARTSAVLTLAYANREALEKTVATKSTWLYSRSRAELWNKGATSGNTQRVVAIAIDCDNDALLYRVIPDGPACHTGAPTCFGEVVALPGAEAAPNGAHFAEAMLALASTIADRHENPPEGSYTAQLFAGGIDRIAKKIGEEATEVVIAAKNEDRGELIWETSDLLYHTMVMLAERKVSLDEIGDELARRAAG
jgi:phosphoribosyl-ATP pyrophosphohydrolase/phosphoribosyl-AMP cyclohydrolase